jgi:hypothetical protein
MELQDMLIEQAKELRQFLTKQESYIINYKAEAAKNIALIEDKKIKAKCNTMLKEAIKGNLENVQKIAESLQMDIKK